MKTRKPPGSAAGRPRQERPAIVPTALYSRQDVTRLLRMADDRLKQETDSGRLRSRRDGNRIVYLGQWLLDWIAGPNA